MARLPRPVTLETLTRYVGVFKILVLPILAFLVAASIWVHDTNASVKKLETRDSVLTRLDRNVEIINYKVDLLLEDRRVDGKTSPR